MDPMAYLKDLAKRKPNLRLEKALEKLAIAEKAAELRAEVRTSRSSQQAKTRDHHLQGDNGWLSVWEKNRDDIQEAIDNLPPGTEFTGRVVPSYGGEGLSGRLQLVGHTYDSRRLTPGNCNPCVWGVAPESYTFRGPSENMVAQCIHCGVRPMGPITADPADTVNFTIAGETVSVSVPGAGYPALPADADTERLDVYGI